MEIGSTLIGQMITFVIFVWLTMRYVWPILKKILEERQQTIAHGLTAAEQGKLFLQQAQIQAQELLHTARVKHDNIISAAEIEAQNILQQVRISAEKAKNDIISQGTNELVLETRKVRQQLGTQVADLII